MARVAHLRRWTIIALGLSCSALAFAQGFAGVFRDRDPELALELAPWDTRAQAVFASRMLLQSTDATILARADRLARSSLHKEPMQPVALRVIGSVADVQGRSKTALALMSASQLLSRRDILTQLWWIEHFSRTDDISRALSHYDVALSSSEDAWPVLFPVLAGVGGDPDFAQPLRVFFGRHRHRPWRRQLLATMIGSTADPKQLMRWLPGVLDPARPADKDLLRNLIQRLVDSQQFDPAFDVYRRVTGRRGLSPEKLRNADVRAATYPPFDWDLADEADRAAQVVSAEGKPVITMSASDAPGPLAVQLVKLTGGRYRFQLVTVGETLGSGLGLDVSCAMTANAASSAQQTYPLDIRAGRSIAMIEARPGCDWHRLALTYGGTHSGDSFSTNVASASLER